MIIYILNPGANPATMSYTASAVKIYNATTLPSAFWSKNSFFYLLWKNALLKNADVVVVNSEVVEGLGQVLLMLTINPFYPQALKIAANVHEGTYIHTYNIHITYI
jgi:hypothetical protein